MDIEIGIRVDASARMGLGHVKRCLALAHALHQAGAKVTFVCRASDINLAALLEGTPFALHLLEQPGTHATAGNDAPHADWSQVPQPDDAQQTVAALRGLGVAWVIIDHYAFDAGWHQSVAQALGARIAVIDDLADRPLWADLLVDHNLSVAPREKYRGRLARSARQLLGPRYALLGPSYLRAQRYVFHEAVRSIGIFLGGTDPSRLSLAALEACRQHAGWTGPIEVVSTSANRNLAELALACARWPQTSLSLDLPDLAGFFARHDLHIGAGGGATWERCCIGAPTLGLVAADNQRAVLPQLAEVGAVAWMDDDHPQAGAIAQALQELLGDPHKRRALSEHAQALVDGRGAQRVALHMLAESVSLRPARLEDARLLHEWRNDDRTRAVSHDPRPIAFEDHCRWMEAVLADKDRMLWVGSVGRIPVGAIRFDKGGDGHFTVSLYLDPTLHGLGLGGGLLHGGERALLAEVGAPVQLRAEVLDANAASHGLFASAGYSRHADPAAPGWRYDKCIGADHAAPLLRELAP